MLTPRPSEDGMNKWWSSETREELLLAFPGAAFPLSVADVRHSIQRRAQLWLKKGWLLCLFIAGKKAVMLDWQCHCFI